MYIVLVIARFVRVYSRRRERWREAQRVTSSSVKYTVPDTFLREEETRWGSSGEGVLMGVAFVLK